MKRSNWKMLMDQFDYIHEAGWEMIDALDAGDNALYDEAKDEYNLRTDALIRLMRDVLEDEKDSLID